MAEDTIVATPLADAGSFAAHRAMREGKGTATPEPKKDAPAPAETAQPDTSVQESPEEKQQKKDRSFHGRISELTSARDTEKARADRLEEELRQSRTRKPDPTPAKPEGEAKAEEKPKLKDFVANAKEGEQYDDVVERWADAVDDWKEKKRNAERQQSEQTSHQAKVKEKALTKMEAARAKYADYDQVTAGDLKAGTGLILSNPMINYFLDEEDGVDVVYELAKQPEEYKRIKGLPEERQHAALGRFAAKLSSETKVPDKPKPVPVSKVPEPPAKVGGAEESAPKSAAEARNMAEYKRMRAAK